MGKTELRIEIDAQLLERARAAGVDLDALTEAALRAVLAEHRYDMAADPAGAEVRGRQWATENAEALKAYAERIEREGCFGEEWRTW